MDFRSQQKFWLFWRSSLNSRLQKLKPYLKVFKEDIERSDLFKQTSAMAYVTLLSIIPSLAAFFALVSLFAPMTGGKFDLFSYVQDFILKHLAAASSEQVLTYINGIVKNLDLKKIGITSFIGLVVSLVLLLRQIELAFNRIWLVNKERSIARRIISFWTFITLGSFISALAVGVISDFNWRNLVPFADARELSASFFDLIKKLLAQFGIAWIGFYFVFRIFPNTKVSHRAAFLGACFSTIFFSIANKFYQIFILKFTNYQILYGALAAIPMFLLWLYICWLITLSGCLLAWRVDQKNYMSFKDAEEGEDNFLVRFNNSLSRVFLPFYVLARVYEDQEKRRYSKDIVLEVSKELKISPRWVEDTFHLLEQKKFLARIISPIKTKDDVSDHYLGPYVPCVLIAELTVGEFLEEISADFSQKIETSEISIKVKEKYLRILSAGSLSLKFSQLHKELF